MISKQHSHQPATPTVLVTGVAGYIGSHFALACQDAGWRVVGIDDLSTGQRKSVPDQVDFFKIDVSDPSVKDIIREKHVDVAVHFAGLIDVEESFVLPSKYYETNFTKAMRFFEHANEAEVRGVVLSSTAAVYGKVDNVPLTEEAQVTPHSPYGRSKLAAEWGLNDLCRNTGMPSVILRYFNVAGADPQLRSGPRAAARHLIKVVSEAVTGQRESVVINGVDYTTHDGSAVRDYVHVTDLVDTHLSAVRHIMSEGRSLTLNVGYGTGSSVKDVIDCALKLYPRTFEVIQGPRRIGDLEYVVADATALSAQFPWNHRWNDLSLILKSAIDWENKRLAEFRK